ncbi:hypothetical protein [Caballeronia sp. SBC2]|uniref:hypothetical protein n=1 Tax=Caballeronia sp. SBC2 TaxID=2705547 RepID=UPI0013E165FD|nr:hypothetical protein [Caballeronia sp. SBC2]QIE24819.1 hypothetical protein SBC2_28690 [Caballeronia sp. SBC2]
MIPQLGASQSRLPQIRPHHFNVVVADLYCWGQMQMPFCFSGLVLLTLFATAGRYREMAVIALLSFIVKVAVKAIMTRWSGMAGILNSTALMHATTLIRTILYASGWSAAKPRAVQI